MIMATKVSNIFTILVPVVWHWKYELVSVLLTFEYVSISSLYSSVLVTSELRLSEQ
jgi:hypothetical protein